MRADTTCQRRNRSGCVNNANVSSALKGTRTDFSIVIGASFLLRGLLGCGRRELLELGGPERVEAAAQRRHAAGTDPVAAEPAVPPDLDQAGGGQHAKVL